MTASHHFYSYTVTVNKITILLISDQYSILIQRLVCSTTYKPKFLAVNKYSSLKYKYKYQVPQLYKP